MESIFSKLKSYFSRLNGMGGREGEGVGRGTGRWRRRGGERDGGPSRGQVPFSGVCVCPHLVLF